MRTTPIAFACVLLMFAPPRASGAVDWKTFEDTAAVVLTDTVAKSIGELAADEKAAAVRKLHGYLEAKTIEVRRRAALTLDKLGDKAGVPVMIDALAKAEGRDRDNVIVALRIMKDARAIPALRTMLTYPSPYVRCIAASALGELKAVKAYDDLVALTTDKGNKDGDPKPVGLNCIPMIPAQSACYALGALGEKKAVPVLINLLPDKDTRNAARQALEALTGQKLGEDAEKWLAWWKEQEKPK